MTKQRESSPDDLQKQIEAEFEAATFIPLRKALEPYLVKPYTRLLLWPYSSPEPELPCWIIADMNHLKPGLTLAYSSNGHADPWGIVFANDTYFGRDDSWFTNLEDAFISSGAWTQPLPPEYEVR